jgi:acetylornithine/N-succinyldiaminopimelate aminotransferase
MIMEDWQALGQKYLMNNITRLPLTLVRGEGVWVWDDRGNKYLDFVGGWAVDILGHSPPVVAEALSRQARTIIQTSNSFYNIPQVQLARMLVEHSCLQKVFFANSGAEANEGAVKLARRYGKLKRQGAYEVITTINSFHGRTLAMVAATGQAKFQEPYTPLTPGFINVPFNDIEALKAATTERTCAVMLEPIQAEGGVHMPAKGYLAAVREWCTEKGLLLILDEVQTGMGRTGKLFAYEHYGIEPDVMTLAKGLAGGVPIGALLAKEAAAVFKPGEHGSTFGGNPLACAAGCAALQYVLDHDIPRNAENVGQYLFNGLRALKHKNDIVKEVRGLGLLIGLEFHADIARMMREACEARGLLVNDLKPNMLRFIPPLITEYAHIDMAAVILDEALDDVLAQH